MSCGGKAREAKAKGDKGELFPKGKTLLGFLKDRDGSMFRALRAARRSPNLRALTGEEFRILLGVVRDHAPEAFEEKKES